MEPLTKSCLAGKSRTGRYNIDRHYKLRLAKNKHPAGNKLQDFFLKLVRYLKISRTIISISRPESVEYLSISSIFFQQLALKSRLLLYKQKWQFIFIKVIMSKNELVNKVFIGRQHTRHNKLSPLLYKYQLKATGN